MIATLRSSSIVVSATLICCSPSAAWAHDFWIEPSTFRPEANALVKVSLKVGEHFKGEPVLRNADKIERFIMVGPDGERAVLGQDGADPAGLVRPAQSGIHVLGYRSKESAIELEAEKFESYLREEGLEGIIADRKARGESTKSGKERYSRCAKALLACGDKADGADRVLGFTLELVPEKNPSASSAADSFAVRILYDGKPLAGAHVVAMHHAEPDKAVSAKSDAEGRAAFQLTKPGIWMVKAVHMVRSKAGADSDWTSYWASLTFERP